MSLLSSLVSSHVDDLGFEAVELELHMAFTALWQVAICFRLTVRASGPIP